MGQLNFNQSTPHLALFRAIGASQLLRATTGDLYRSILSWSRLCSPTRQSRGRRRLRERSLAVKKALGPTRGLVAALGWLGIHCMNIATVRVVGLLRCSEVGGVSLVR